MESSDESDVPSEISSRVVYVHASLEDAVKSSADRAHRVSVSDVYEVADPRSNVSSSPRESGEANREAWLDSSAGEAASDGAW